jgi:uncharacterized protein
MKLHLNTGNAKNIFTAHGKGYVTVNGQRFEHPIVVTPEQVLADWQPLDFLKINEADFNYFMPLKPEILLLGSGPKQFFLHPGLYRQLTNAGIGVEFMDTPAACRTYNILVSEDRKVVAAILI